LKTIAVLNQKGGVGKTTTVVNTAAALAKMGQRVVVIDLDPQAHLTIHLGLEPQWVRTGSYAVLTQAAPFEKELMMVRLNLWLLAANINLVGAETELVSVVGRETILREALEPAQDKFDFCFIDCPPSLGLLTLNALAAAEEVLIPLQPHFLALQGFSKLLQTIGLVNRRINPQLKVKGILLCMFDTRASLPNEVKADIEQFLQNARGSNCAWAGAKILPTFIRRNIKLAEAPSYGKTIFEYEPNCNGAQDYLNVARYIYHQAYPQSPAERAIQVQYSSDSANLGEQPSQAQPAPTPTAPTATNPEATAPEQPAAPPSDPSAPQPATQPTDAPAPAPQPTSAEQPPTTPPCPSHEPSPAGQPSPQQPSSTAPAQDPIRPSTEQEQNPPIEIKELTRPTAHQDPSDQPTEGTDPDPKAEPIEPPA